MVLVDLVKERMATDQVFAEQMDAALTELKQKLTDSINEQSKDCNRFL